MQQQAKSKWADHWDNQRPHHSQLWTEQVDEETKRLAKQLDASTVYEIKKNDPHFPDSRKTVDFDEEYENMLVQDNSLPVHSPYYYQREREVEDDLAQEEAALPAEVKEKAELRARGELPDEDETPAEDKHHPNTSLDYGEVWGGSVLLQLEDHINDDDDIVPELTDPVLAQKKAAAKDARKKDFAGELYTEVYDE